MVGGREGFLILIVTPYFYDGSRLEVYVESDAGRLWEDLQILIVIT